MLSPEAHQLGCAHSVALRPSSGYSAALGGCGETRAERKLLRAIGDCGQKVEGGKDPDLRTGCGCGLSVVSVDGKKTRPGGNVAEHFVTRLSPLL